MRKAVPVIAVIAIVLALLVASVVMGLSAIQSGNSPTPTPTASPSPSPSPIATPSNSTPSPSFTPYDFNISSPYDNTTFKHTQGGSIMGTIKLTTINGNVQSVNPQNVTWSADSGSSGIQCDFDSTSIAYREDMIGMFFKIQDGFSSWFTITIPNSTPTDNYAITVTAKIGSVSHSITMWISVESSFITVSGTINAGNSGITPYQLQFHNLASTTDGYLATLTANTYSISIPNNQVYFVSVNDGTALDRTGLWHNLDTFFEVEVPAGSTSMTKDFTFGS